MRPRSAKREKQYESYRLAREEYLKNHPNCQVRGCKRLACDIHHKAKRDGERLTDQKHWMAVCRECHAYIGNNPAWAYQQGYLEQVIRKAG
ncbi:hypothetical protein [Thermoleptolyngbya sp.]